MTTDTDETYSSIPETLAHQQRVVELMAPILEDLAHRARHHDASKTRSPEVEYFDRYTPKLAEHPYGTPGYFRMLEEMAPALDHHFAHNDHHPQFYPEGVRGMNLVSLLEMLVDWRAAGERNPSGSMKRSLEINATRFDIPEPLLEILYNTAIYLGWLDTEDL